MSLRMIDLARQRAALEPELSAALQRVLDQGAFIGGPQVTAFEATLGARVGVAHVVGCANGTDALELLLLAEGIGPGDAVVVPALTFVATAGAVALTGATPVFADVEPGNGTLCPNSVAAALGAIAADGVLRARAVIAVDLFSMPADAQRLGALCRDAGLLHFTDAAHSIGTRMAQGACGSLCDGAATSFYPSKGLGCYGDGGAVMVRDSARAARLRSIANHGNANGVAHAVQGKNSRLDTLQAAVLLEKLRLFDAEMARRHEICARYCNELSAVAQVPTPPEACAPVWSYFVLRHPRRDALQAHLASRNVPSVAYYRVPTHLTPAFQDCPRVPGDLPVTMDFAQSLLCLPAHAYLTDDDVTGIIAAVLSFGV